MRIDMCIYGVYMVHFWGIYVFTMKTRLRTIWNVKTVKKVRKGRCYKKQRLKDFRIIGIRKTEGKKCNSKLFQHI